MQTTHSAFDGLFLKITKILLENGADPNKTDYYGHTPLHRAASKGNAKIVKLLLEHQVDLDTRDATGSTPL